MKTGEQLQNISSAKNQNSGSLVEEVKGSAENVGGENTDTTNIHESSAFHPPMNADYVQPQPAPFLNEWETEMEGDAVVEEISETKSLPLIIDRSDIPTRLDDVLTAEQKLYYHWDEAVAAFSETNIVGHKQLTRARFEQWVRINLKRGWEPGMEAPSIFEVKVTGIYNNLPVIEAFLFRDAYAAAGTLAHLIPDTGQHFYWKKKISGELHVSGYGTKSEEKIGETTRNEALTYNKKYSVWSMQMAHTLFQISYDNVTYNYVLGTKIIDDYYINLIVSAQRILFADTPDNITGKLNPDTLSEIDKWNLLTAYQQDIKRVYGYFLIHRNGLSDNWDLTYRDEAKETANTYTYSWTPSQSINPLPNISQATPTYGITIVPESPSDETLNQQHKQDINNSIWSLAQVFAPSSKAIFITQKGSIAKFTDEVFALYEKNRINKLEIFLNNQPDTRNELKLLHSMELLFMARAANLIRGESGACFQTWLQLRNELRVFDLSTKTALTDDFKERVNDFYFTQLYALERHHLSPIQLPLHAHLTSTSSRDYELLGITTEGKEKSGYDNEREWLSRAAYSLNKILFEKVFEQHKTDDTWKTLATEWNNHRYLMDSVEDLDKNGDPKHPVTKFNKLSCWFVPHQRDQLLEDTKNTDPRLQGKPMPEGAALMLYYGFDNKKQQYVCKIVLDPESGYMASMIGDTLSEALETINTNKLLPYGKLYYTDPNSKSLEQLDTEGGETLSSTLGKLALVIGLSALILMSGGLAAIPGAGILTTAAVGGSIAIGLAASGAYLYESYKGDKLTNQMIAFEAIMAAGLLLPMGRGLRWLGGDVYVLVSVAAEGVTIGGGALYFTYHTLLQIREINALPPDKRGDAILWLILSVIVVGGFTRLGAKNLSKVQWSGPEYVPKPGDATLINDPLVDPVTCIAEQRVTQKVTPAKVHEAHTSNSSHTPLKEGQFTANPPENIPHATHENAPAIPGEEPHIAGKAQTAEGHTIKVNREGEIGICSICEIIRKEFAVELEKHLEIKQELDQIYLEPDPQVKAEKAAEIQSRLLALRNASVTVQKEYWKEEQIVYTAGNPEYIKLTMIDDPLQVFTLRRDEGGDWYVIKRSEAARLKNKLMDTEIVARVPERFRAELHDNKSISISDEIDSTIDKLRGKAVYELNNTGEYQKVGGHHPMAKKAFEGDINYDYKKAFSVKNSALEIAWKSFNNGIPQNLHAKITGNQNKLYSIWKQQNPDTKLTIEVMANIEIQAMTNVGIPQDVVVGWVIKSLEDLKIQGITKIVNIPWNGKNVN